MLPTVSPLFFFAAWPEVARPCTHCSKMGMGAVVDCCTHSHRPGRLEGIWGNERVIYRSTNRSGGSRFEPCLPPES
jgi:hypothetical protein